MEVIETVVVMICFVDRDVIGEMPMGKFFEEQYQFAELFNRLGLDDAEVGLLTASMIVCPGTVTHL